MQALGQHFTTLVLVYSLGIVTPTDSNILLPNVFYLQQTQQKLKAKDKRIESKLREYIPYSEAITTPNRWRGEVWCAARKKIDYSRLFGNRPQPQLYWYEGKTTVRPVIGRSALGAKSPQKSADACAQTSD